MATKLTKLAAVNIVLSNIGMAPVNAIDNDNPMVLMASNTIDEVSLSVQSDGYTFNTEREYPFTPNSSNQIIIPDNVLALDSPYDQESNLIIRGGKLYDKRDHSFTFTEQLKLNVLWLFDFDDMPEPFKNYVSLRSANLFAGRAVGSAEQVRFGEREEAMARAAMIEYETQQGDYNYLSPFNLKNYNTYAPYQGTLRY